MSLLTSIFICVLPRVCLLLFPTGVICLRILEWNKHYMTGPMDYSCVIWAVLSMCDRMFTNKSTCKTVHLIAEGVATRLLQCQHLEPHHVLTPKSRISVVINIKALTLSQCMGTKAARSMLIELWSCAI